MPWASSRTLRRRRLLHPAPLPPPPPPPPLWRLRGRRSRRCKPCLTRSRRAPLEVLVPMVGADGVHEAAAPATITTGAGAEAATLLAAAAGWAGGIPTHRHSRRAASISRREESAENSNGPTANPLITAAVAGASANPETRGAILSDGAGRATSPTARATRSEGR